MGSLEARNERSSTSRGDRTRCAGKYGQMVFRMEWLQMTIRSCSQILSALVFAAVIISPPRSASQTVPKQSDLCRVTSVPSDFNGQYLSIHGNFEKGLEYTDISHTNCTQVIALILTDASNEDPGLKAILAAYYCPPFRSRGKRMSGDFIGRFEYLPGQRPSWVIHLDRVSGVHIEIDSCGIQ